MQVIYNTHSLQSKFIPEWVDNPIGVKDIEQAMPYVKDYKHYILIGFIYKEGKFDYFKYRNTYFITNVGVLPDNFNTVGEDKKHYSFLHQLLLLKLVEGTKELKRVAQQHDNYFNFLSSDTNIQNFLLDFSYNEVDELIEKCYYSNIGNKHVYLMYENNPKLKLPMAHRALEDKEGLFIVISQTRSDNDILTIFSKGNDLVKLSEAFEVENPINSNILTMFIPSHINVLGKQITRFLEENNGV